jgi:hypothetical protein
VVRAVRSSWRSGASTLIGVGTLGRCGDRRSIHHLHQAGTPSRAGAETPPPATNSRRRNLRSLTSPPRPLQPRDRPTALPLPPHDRHAPVPDLPKARHNRARRARPRSLSRRAAIATMAQRATDGARRRADPTSVPSFHTRRSCRRAPQRASPLLLSRACSSHTFDTADRAARAHHAASQWPGVPSVPKLRGFPVKPGEAYFTPTRRNLLCFQRLCGRNRSLHVLLAMQKVVDSNPFSRFTKDLHLQVFFASPSDAVGGTCA